MKFIVSNAELLKALMAVSKAIPAKSNLPILENFLFELNGGILEITASDQELTLKTSIEVESTEEEGSIAVPARHISELLKALPDQPVTLKTLNDRSVEISWSSGNSCLPFFPADDYPAIKSVGEDAEKITMPAETLIAGISGTVYATADDIRPAMNGIFFDIDTESTTLVASDAHKLICYTTDKIKAENKSSFILHKKPALVIKSILSKEDEEVQIAFDQATVLLTFGSTSMICRLVTGKYPKYRDVIPQNNSNLLKIDRGLLLNTIKRVSVCANKASNHVKFELKPGQLEITAQDLGFEIAAYEKINCDYNGEEIEIGFKSSFFMEILSNLNCDNVTIKFADSRRPAVILPSEEETEADNICGIIMPIMIS